MLSEPGLDAKEDGGQGFREVLELQHLDSSAFRWQRRQEKQCVHVTCTRILVGTLITSMLVCFSLVSPDLYSDHKALR